MKHRSPWRALNNESCWQRYALLGVSSTDIKGDGRRIALRISLTGESTLDRLDEDRFTARPRINPLEAVLD